MQMSQDTVFRSSMERWADGLKSLEMQQGGHFSHENGTWEAPSYIGDDYEHIGVPYK